MNCSCPSGWHDCPLHGLEQPYGPTGPGTPDARMVAVWKWSDQFDVELEEIVGYHPLMNVPREVALMAAFEKLLDWWQQTRSDLATPIFTMEELRGGFRLPEQKQWHGYTLKDEDTERRFLEKLKELGVPVSPTPQHIHQFKQYPETWRDEWYYCNCDLETRSPTQYRRLVNGKVAEPL